MNTPFGKLIEKSGFGTIFQMVVLVSVFAGVMNAMRLGCCWGIFGCRDWWPLSMWSWVFWC